MILNDYLGQLPENKETAMTFHADKWPIVLVRRFPFWLEKGKDRLLIPYYVDDCDEGLYRQNRQAMTFTTIISLDEDTVPEAEVKRWKRTTYAGEQVMDLGVFDDPGIHSFSIRCISSDGIGSPVTHLQFMVRDSSEDKTFNLTTADRLSSSFAEGQDGRTKYGGGVNDYNEIVDNCSYAVNVSRNRDGSFKEAVVEVSGSWHYTLLSNTAKQHDKDMTGLYKLTTVYDNDGTECLLTDCLDTPALELPKAAILAAAGNKVALTLLMRAVKAAGYRTLALPGNATLVLDYHAADGSTTEDYKESRDDIEFPDRFTLDLNDSSLCALQSVDMTGGHLVIMRGNTDVWVKNGYVKGHYRRYDFPTSKKHIKVATKTSEHFNTVAMSGCTFCGFENVETSHSVGYDWNWGFSDAIGLSVNPTTTVAPAFNKYGYIDYDGVEHEVPTEESAGFSDTDLHLMYTGGGEENHNGVRLLFNSRYPVVWGNWHLIKKRHSTLDTQDGSISRECTRIMFVHYYDAELNFIKTVKACDNQHLLRPYGAAYVKLTMKGRKASGHIDSLNYDGVGQFHSTHRNISHGCAYISCRAHDNRSCVCLCNGYQFLVSHCSFWNIAAETGANAITKLFVDVEDSSWYHWYNFIEDVEWLYGDIRTCCVYNCNHFNVKDSRDFYLDFRSSGVTNGLIDGFNGTYRDVCTYKFPDQHLQITNTQFTVYNSELGTAGNRGAHTGEQTLRYCQVHKTLSDPARLYGIQCESGF